MNFIKKMKSGRGVTIGEMLTALLIMVFLTLTVAGGAGVALKVYRTQTCYSESRVLANSILVAMAEELRYASEAEVSADSNSISYNSRTYGAGAVMDIEPWSADTGGGRLRIQYDKGEDGEAEGGETDYPTATPPIQASMWRQLRTKRFLRRVQKPAAFLSPTIYVTARGKSGLQ